MKIVLFQINCQAKNYTKEHLQLFHDYLSLLVQNGLVDKITVCSTYHSSNFELKRIFNEDYCRVFLGNSDFLFSRINLCLEDFKPDLVLRLSDGMFMVDHSVFKNMENEILHKGKDFCCLKGNMGSSKGMDMLAFSFGAFEKLKAIVPMGDEGKNLKSLFLEYGNKFEYMEFVGASEIRLDKFFSWDIRNETGFKTLSMAISMNKFDFRDIWNCYIRYYGKIRRPSVIGIELTNHCNLSCIMCVRDIMTRPLGFMKKEVFEKIIDDLKDMGGMEDSTLSLAQFGESLIHPDFIGMVKYAAGRGFWNLELSTNGLLIDEKMAVELMESGIKQLHISVDGNSAKTYESIRIRGKFDKLVNNIEMLVRLKRVMKSDMMVRLQIIHSKETAPEIEDFVKRWRYKVDGIMIKPVHTWAGQLDEDLSSDGECIKDYLCEAFWTNLSIHWDGTVSACCVDINQQLRLGHVEKESLSDIWNSGVLADLRYSFIRKEWDRLSLCEKCSCRWGRLEF